MDARLHGRTPAWMQVVEPRLEQAAEVVEPRLEQAAEVVEPQLGTSGRGIQEGGPGVVYQARPGFRPLAGPDGARGRTGKTRRCSMFDFNGGLHAGAELPATKGCVAPDLIICLKQVENIFLEG